MATHSQSLKNRRRRQKTLKTIKRDTKRAKKAGGDKPAASSNA